MPQGQDFFSVPEILLVAVLAANLLTLAAAAWIAPFERRPGRVCARTLLRALAIGDGVYFVLVLLTKHAFAGGLANGDLARGAAPDAQQPLSDARQRARRLSDRRSRAALSSGLQSFRSLIDGGARPIMAVMTARFCCRPTPSPPDSSSIAARDPGRPSSV
jgi:hypothetical protein